MDYLKIDRSFAEALGEGVEGEGIVTATIALAHTLGLKAVAEGVEDVPRPLRFGLLGF